MNRRMPIVIYIFALCAFALGFTEFVSIGLVSNIAHDLNSSVSQVGTAVTAYALGAVIAAPILPALCARCSRKRLLLLAMALFSLGNLWVSLSDGLTSMLIARFVSGLGHGVFLAVASSVAAQVAGQQRAGTAVAVVFAGLTLALALGVPIGTYLGGIFSWPLIFVAVTVCGLIGLIGLLLFMPKTDSGHGVEAHAIDGLKAIFNPHLLTAAGITVLSYAGAFTLYTYISALLLEVTQVTHRGVSIFMLCYGLMAAMGNIWGGRLTDRKGADTAVFYLLIALMMVLLAIWISLSSVVLMALLIGLLGALSYAIVPALQARIIHLAQIYAPNAPEVASGLNIAGFNAGIALGALLGGASLQLISLHSCAWVGAACVALALTCLLGQMRSAHAKHLED